MSRIVNPAVELIVEQIKQAAENANSLFIKGHGSKRFLSQTAQGDVLSTQSLDKIVSYEPSELVVTAEAGVSLLELENLLAASGQRLSFEPPLYAGAHEHKRGTVGGMIASGLAGPRRPWAGAVRDSVLGLHLINGRGEYLRFGGQVMKNVAGYDVSRLMVGAMGCLGLMTQVSLKVQPVPQGASFFSWECSLSSLLDCYAKWQRSMNPLTGLAHDGTRAYVRLEGGDESRALFASRNSLLSCDDQGAFWDGLRNHSLPFFESGLPLWRVSVPPLSDLTKALSGLSAAYLMDWAGAQYWVRTTDEDAVRSIATQYGGSVRAYGEGVQRSVVSPGVLQTNAKKRSALSTLAPPLLLVHQRLKKAYDPTGVFNAGVMHDSF